MNMNEEYLDSLLKSMNNDSAAPDLHQEENPPFQAPEADRKPEKEDKAGASLSPEEIAALFDAAEKIANGEEPDSLSEDAEEAEPAPAEEEESVPTAEKVPDSLPTAEEETPEKITIPESMEKELQELERMTQEQPDAEGDLPLMVENPDDVDEPSQSMSEEPSTNVPEELSQGMAEEPSTNVPEEPFQGMTEEPSRDESAQDFTPSQAENDDGIMEMDLADIEDLLEDRTEKKEKKPGFFKRLLAFFTEEDSPEEPEKKDENEEVLAELEEEDKTASKDKKKKKEKKKKDKPAKGSKKNAKSGGDEESEEEEGGKPGKGKGKAGKGKAPKKKKEKAPVPETEEKVSKGYTKKNIILVCLFSAAVFAVLYLSISYVAPGYAKKNAVAAFERQDYLTCYEILYGQKMTDREEQLFTFSKMVLQMQKKVNDYQKYVNDGEELYALDSLIQAVEEYEETQEEAINCGADGEMLKIYREVLTVFQENYGLDEEGVRNIASCKDKVAYTRMLTALINGDTVDVTTEPAQDAEELPDLLPEEEDSFDTEFLPEEDNADADLLPEENNADADLMPEE